MKHSNAQRIHAEYQRLRAEGHRLGASIIFHNLSDQFADKAIWKSYAWLLDMAAPPPPGAAVGDLGCKSGPTQPFFPWRGARRANGIDVGDDYLETGRRIVSTMYPAISFAKSDRGYIDLPPASVDFVLVNEVISHVNSMYLPNVYSEIARILKPGGQVMI